MLSLLRTVQDVSPLLIAIVMQAVASAMCELSSSIGPALPGAYPSSISPIIPQISLRYLERLSAVNISKRQLMPLML
ncbi:hypothetical protein SynBIOSE41_02061 [Synechococcus sp. BIOS-E4-1]|nr:hypothetical protein SynBIOSE41_02061 [Synechococcus sp. BIOS-E4-1]